MPSVAAAIDSSRTATEEEDPTERQAGHLLEV